MPSSSPASVASSVPPRGDRWVVGFDGSDASSEALSWAISQASGRTTCLEIVTAWQAPSSSSAISISQANDVARSTAERSAEEAQQATRRQLSSSGTVDVMSTCLHGGASAVLLDQADTASLLVVGTRGRGGFARLLVGSTSNQCATHAVVPTVVVRSPTSAAARIVVAVDGSDNSLAGLRWAIEFAAPGSELHVVLAWDISPLAVGADQFFFPEAADLARERFDQMIDDHHKVAANGDVSLTTEFIEGSPRSTLVRCSAGSDLIVAGARGHGPIGAALLGSVSSWLVHHAECSVALVPA